MTYQPEINQSFTSSLVVIGGIMWMTTTNLEDHDGDKNTFPNLQQGTVQFTSSIREVTVDLVVPYETNYEITLSPQMATITQKNNNSFILEANSGFNGTINWSTLGGETPRLSDNFLECDGRSLSVNGYIELFSVIGFNFGGSGNNFNIPDLKGRCIFGEDRQSGLTNGSYGGSHEHQLTQEEMPEHRHFYRDYYIGYRDIKRVILQNARRNTNFSTRQIQYPRNHDQVKIDAFGADIPQGAAIGSRIDFDNFPYGAVWNRTAGRDGTPWSENTNESKYNRHILRNAGGPWGRPPFGGRGGGGDIPHYNIAPYATMTPLIRYRYKV